MNVITRPYYFTWNHQPTEDMFPVERAEHDQFVLADGRRVFDLISTSFQANFGHSHAGIREAIHCQLDRMPVASPKASFDLKRDVTERLLDLMQLEGGKIFYTVSGSESVENALKMARQITGRTKILARQKSYHGASLGALSVTGDWRNAPHFTIDEQTIRFPEPADDPDLTATRKIVERVGEAEIAAVIVETVSGTNGVAIASQQWWDALQTLCRESGILLIIDEVLCGFGRTGPPFAFQAYGIRPDFVCMSKAITGGYIPFGAVWTGSTIVDFYAREKLTCGLTSYAHPLGLAALDAVLRLMKDPMFLDHKSQLESRMESILTEWASWPIVREIRRSGLLAAIDLRRQAPTWQTMFDRGVHAYSSGEMLVVAPPLVSDLERMAAAFDVIAALIRED